MSTRIFGKTVAFIIAIVVASLCGGASAGFYYSQLRVRGEYQDRINQLQMENDELRGVVAVLNSTNAELEALLGELQQSTQDIGPVDLSNVTTAKLSFLEYYSHSPVSVTLQAPQYELPMRTEDISNYPEFSERIPLSEDALRLLERNGFVVIDNPFDPVEEEITRPYEDLGESNIPIFITSDSLLHLYHIQFDETLRQIEEKEFYDAIWRISEELLDDSVAKYDIATGDLKEASRRNAAYFAVALSLLQPREEQVCRVGEGDLANAYFKPEELEKYSFEVPEFVDSLVEDELNLIGGHEDFAESPLFIYREDYTQYLPRGHYTRSEKLKNYFRAFMWYGRISMLLKGTDQVEAGQSCNVFPPCMALISLYDAKIQTMQACLTANRFAESEDLRSRWNRIYSVTSFYVGLSDDLGPFEYIDALNHVFDGKFDLNDLDEEAIGEVKAKLAEFSPPAIYGGTGEVTLLPPFTPEQADEILDVTKGFRLMGQRFIPDSYILQNLVPPKVLHPLGPDRPFTWVMTDAGPVRGFPRGLDVMALLGSDRAVELLDELKDSNYENYTTQFNLLKEEFDNFTEEDWHKNLYWAWLYSLKPLQEEFGEGYPTFMQTQAWRNKELTTSLASWAELRHDTILYAKQSYTVTLSSAPIKRPAIGYIEPVPEFYNRLLALTRMTKNGLEDMNILDRSAMYRLDNLERILERLVELSIKELRNEELTQGDYDFIRDFGEELNDVIAEVDDRAKKTTIVADVHTEQNTKQVLEEGVGYVKLMVVAYKVPDGRILIGAGPVMSYYEFKWPMSDRLTDEKWQEMLESNPPEPPEWIPNFTGQ